VICLGFHEGVLAWVNPTNDGALYRCACGEERWLNVALGTAFPLSLRWEAS
jgi:hypothetical protein